MLRRFGYGFTVTAILFSVFVFASVAFGARALYDDFSSGLQEYKFDAGPMQREIISGELVSGLARRANPDGFRRNRTPFANPNTINVIQADVRVDFTNAADVENVAAQIEGVFYKAMNGQEIWAGVFIGDHNAGLQAWWGVAAINVDQSVNLINSGPITSGLSPGTFYTTKISYNGADSFTFEVNGISQSYALGLPHFQRAGDPENFQMKSLTTVIEDWQQDAGAVFARFDNVYVNANPAVYDDFSGGVLDATKWWQWEFVRQIANPSGNNLVRLDIRSLGIIQSCDLPLQYDNTPYLEANITVKSGTGMSSPAFGRARIGGFYYNQSRGPGSGLEYNGWEGDVFVQAGLQTYFDGGTLKLKAVCKADASNVDATSYTPVFSHDFATNIGFDTQHNFSISFSGTTVTCSYDGTPFTYNITSPVYEASESTRTLSSRVQASSGNGGYLLATYDDVYVDFQTITGTVVDESNTPVAGVPVSFWNEMHVGGGTTSGADGTFTLNNVMPGALGFRVMPDVSTGLAWYQDEFFLNPGQPMNLGMIKLKQGALVSGILQCVDDPMFPYPVENMELWYGGKFDLGYLVTGAGGSFEFRLPLGQYQLNITDDTMFTMVPLQINITDVAQTNYENMTLDAYDWNGDLIQGNVNISVGYTGQAAVVTFMGNEQFSPELFGGLSSLKEMQLDSLGNYSLIVPPSSARGGEGVIVALGTAVEGPDGSESFTVLSYQLVEQTYKWGDPLNTPVNFVYSTTGYNVEGVVKYGASNAPVYHSQVLIYKVGTPDQFAGYCDTDRNGRYTINNVPPGTYKPVAISRDYPTETVWGAPFTITSADTLLPDFFMGGSGFDELAVDLGASGIYHYAGGTWTRLSKTNP